MAAISEALLQGNPTIENFQLAQALIHNYILLLSFSAFQCFKKNLQSWL